MLWLTSILSSLTAETLLNLMVAALSLALAAGLNDRLGALIAACLVLALMLV
jgi:hypothetical protein